MLAFTSAVATAGTIVLTGHDDDFHSTVAGSTQATAQANAMFLLVRGSSTLPVLTFDAGTELTGLLTALGIPFTNVNPDSAANITDSLFNAATFSAFAVASDASCGGCDNSPAGEANIAAHSTAIGAFLNAGGGIIGLAGANSPGYYDFVPQTATSVGGAPSDGYTATGVGGIPAVNGDPTHNLFSNPGTSGESAFYQIAEVNSIGNGTILPPAATTLVCLNCTVTGGVITGGGGGGTGTPEPAPVIFMATGLVCLVLVKKFRHVASR
jgi:hypothetical protein